MSISDPDLDVRDPTESNGANIELSTDGAVSLFSTVLSNALEQQKNNIIQHFESRFATDKSEKATGVDATDFSFKHEDASEYAGAGFTVGDNHIVHFMWDKEDRIKSYTWRELKAVKNILESLQLMLCGKLVKLYTDNQNVVKIVQKGKSGVDAFAYDWSKFNNWVVPPVILITRAINHMQMCKAKGVLVEPKWKSAIFWPRISQWKQFEGYANNPRLASVIDVLPSIIESSKAKSTNNKYRIYFEKFRKWCVSFGLQYSPATSTTISLYIGGLIQQGISVSVLESNYYSIKWHHDKNFKDNPCSDEFLSLVQFLEGGKRIFSKPINKKEPVTPEILQMIISKYGIDNDLSSLRICVLCLLGFSGFLRYSELAAIKAKNITIFDSYMSILLEKSKTNIYRRGSSVIISKTGGNLCPVKWLLKYLQLANIELDSDQYIFRALCYLKTRGIQKLCSKNSPLSYTRAREILLVAFESFWNDDVRKKLVELYFGDLQKHVTTAKLVSERLVESLKAFKRDPTSYDALTQDVEPGCSNIPGDNCCEKFLNYWPVVPRVQWDFFDLLYQNVYFRYFPSGCYPKICIPTNVMLSMMFLAQFNVPTLGKLRYGNAFAVNFALLLFGFLGLAYIIIGILRVQHWESMHIYFMIKRNNAASTIKHICYVFLSLLLFPILSVAVAWFSWPHLIGTEVIYIMAGIFPSWGKGCIAWKSDHRHVPYRSQRHKNYFTCACGSNEGKWASFRKRV
ncbi:unnamed protein product [Mytilus coruscus]|uniref:Tyr recombinase domain-containing protein n=1 Tax=Mytilus coruscus TaxID=42192 RepID=A0A6J8B812_MYTCO|nr:unnamed protein product [Mytilus coruscus]